MLTALLGFLGKIWLNRILEAERAKLEIILQTEKSKLELLLQKSLHMEKTQYDTEFKIYSELWKELCSVRSSVRSLSFHRESNSGSSSASLADKQTTFDRAVTQFASLTEIYRPFFSADVAKLLFELVGLANKEKDRDARDREHRDITIIHAEGVRNLWSMKLKSDEICEAIRERLTGSAALLDK